MTANGDETYLEAVVEQCLPALPYQIKRNLELIQSLDRSCAADALQLRQLHEQYLLKAEDKVLKLPVVVNADGENQGIRALGDAVIIPTTDELMEYTYDPELMLQIEQLQQDCLQQADEKVSVAQQALDWVEAVVQRLDVDCREMQMQLVLPDEEIAAQPNELAACQVTAGSEWLLSKVLEHDPKTGIYKLADEDVESQKSELSKVPLYNINTPCDSSHHSCFLFVYSLPFARSASRRVARCGSVVQGRCDLCRLSGYDFVLSSGRGANSKRQKLCPGQFCG
jgi:hypothetical protein